MHNRLIQAALLLAITVPGISQEPDGQNLPQGGPAGNNPLTTQQIPPLQGGAADNNPLSTQQILPPQGGAADNNPLNPQTNFPTQGGPADNNPLNPQTNLPRQGGTELGGPESPVESPQCKRFNQCLSIKQQRITDIIVAEAQNGLNETFNALSEFGLQVDSIIKFVWSIGAEVDETTEQLQQRITGKTAEVLVKEVQKTCDNGGFREGTIGAWKSCVMSKNYEADLMSKVKSVDDAANNIITTIDQFINPLKKVITSINSTFKRMAEKTLSLREDIIGMLNECQQVAELKDTDDFCPGPPILNVRNDVGLQKLKDQVTSSALQKVESAKSIQQEFVNRAEVIKNKASNISNELNRIVGSQEAPLPAPVDANAPLVENNPGN